MEAYPKIGISANGRYFIRTDTGEPFFLLADTGWNLFNRLTTSEADMYLQNRVDKGFNAILCILIASDVEGTDMVNAYGESPFMNRDVYQPNEAYFQHVDYIINKANSLGICMVIAPVWREWVYDDPNPVISTANKGRWWGEWVGSRYQNNNIIWLNGGDSAFTGYEDIINALADGLMSGDGNDHLITFHGRHENSVPYIPGQSCYKVPCSTSCLFGNASWLHVYGTYGGHYWAYPTYYLISKDYNLSTVKPVFDTEPNYENLYYCQDNCKPFWKCNDQPDVRRGTAAVVREQAYWAVLAGAAGHTYGQNDIWQFNMAGKPGNCRPIYYWDDDRAINAPGAFHMGILRNLMESRPWHTMVPDQSIITGGQSSGYDENHKQASRAVDGKFLLVYLPQGGNITVNMAKISGSTAKAYWFNPRTGDPSFVGEYDSSGNRPFSAPSDGVDNDWVLVLDDKAQNFPDPGSPHH